MHRVCPVCGAYLDPCEVCDCKEEAAPGEQDRKAAQVNDFTDIIAIQNKFVNKKGEHENG